MRFRETSLPGCYEITSEVRADRRGSFVKLFHAGEFGARGLAAGFAEEYVTVSAARVLRGLHFQLPPRDHAKLVRCLRGEVLDVLLDLRVGSPAYGRHEMHRLRGDEHRAIYVAQGVAHGFYVPGAEAVVSYHVTTVHSPEHDSGVRWDSAGIAWPDADPIVSDRDGALAPLAQFHSPFRFAAAGAT